ncbi:phosphate ABC transporter permease PstA [Metabacillus idriensis]|uniref:Phosphate transport system permease protein PstA n=1 Tax=Metabacillus idriensis TaxID=324768 RepID=A0A6I2MHQ3_9BACI|nr:phosphate ABC transporter permease PstA [Metabacillus idriensis]MCM3596235.1 phosphate ABC transporter permease PstA [Metabacillus idriensis]MRX56001.1 phosphate ABC transporter permease PstA [Metabacillus idriensis]OHR73949.1 phosphate ABC transporter, permease protein PstA [Bacillus sp. HMSC76G11]
MNYINKDKVAKKMSSRLAVNGIYKGIFLLATSFALVVLAILLYRIFTQGFSYITPEFFQNFASRRPSASGIKAALVGSLWVMAVVIPVGLILGVGTALYLEEYAKKNRFTNFLQINIANLAGVPSIVFGLLGLTVFVRFFDLGRSILAGGFTMALLVLPVIVVASQEAIKAVPKEMREASFGMGATKWQTIRQVVLPAAVPGILTGSILAFSRAIGETAPLLVVGAFAFVNYLPANVMSTFTVMPIQIFNWASRPQADFQDVAAAGIIVLFIFLIVMNSVAILIRNKFQKNY